MARDIFQGLPASPQIHAVADLRIPGHRAHLGVEKVRNQSRDRVSSDHGVGIDADEYFLVTQMLEPEVKRLSLAEIGLGQNQHAIRGSLRENSIARDFQSPVARPIVNDDHMQLRIVRAQSGTNGPLNYFLFVICRNQNRYVRLVGFRFPWPAIMPLS